MTSPVFYHEHMCATPEWAIKHAELWLPCIQNAWHGNVPGNAAVLNQTLQNAFKCKGNPYWLALELILTTDFHVARYSKDPTLAVAIMQFFLKLAQDQALAVVPRQIALSAFSSTFMNVSNELFDLVVKAYRIRDNTLLCLPVIRQALAENSMPIENCARAVFALNLLNCFSVRELLFPLFAQSSTKRLHELLNMSEGKQAEFAGFLDSLLGDEVEPGLAAAVERYKTNKVGKAALNRSNLKTTVLRLVKKYQLNPDMCPNASRMQRNATLAYLLREIYVDRSVPKDDWLDMVCDFVGHDLQLQQQTLRFMISAKNGDFATAAACSRLWNLGPAQVPHALTAVLTGNKLLTSTSFAGDNTLPDGNVGRNSVLSTGDMLNREFIIGTNAAAHDAKFYPLKLCDSDIVFVDDKPKFERFLRHATVEYGMNIHVVGIDCEWRPVFQASKKAQLALLQVATKFTVHVFDMITLKTILEPMHWPRLVHAVFLQNAIVKMGFSLTGDLGMLCDFDPAFKLLRQGGANILDMSTVCLKFFKEKPEVYPYYDPKLQSGRGLTDYVKLCFGLPLDKSEQKSNWERRPLRRSQLHYAALDAFCLTEIYEMLNMGCFKLELNFTEFCQNPKAKEKSPTRREQAKSRTGHFVQKRN